MGEDDPRAEGQAEPKPARLFVAFDVPEAVASELRARVLTIRGSVPGARWTRMEGWHVTLKFLGWVHREVQAEVEAGLRAVASAGEPVVTRLTRVGAFPAPSRARVLWAGLSDTDGRFAEMVRLLDERLAEWFAPERRAFEPHLTLARIDPPARVASEVLGLDVASPPFVVDRLILYRSVLSPNGAPYEVVSVAPFGHGSWDVDA